MSIGRRVDFFHVCPCGCKRIIPIAEQDHYSLEEKWRQIVRGVVVAVDVPRPTATPARVVRHGLSVDGDQGAPDHPQDTYTSTCELPGASQASGSPGRPHP